MKVILSENDFINVVVDLQINDSLRQAHKEGVPMLIDGLDHIEWTGNSIEIHGITCVSGSGHVHGIITKLVTKRDIVEFVGKSDTVKTIAGKPLLEFSDLAGKLYERSA